MTLFPAISILLAVMAAESASPTLSFDAAVRMAGRANHSDPAALRSAMDALRRSRLPNVRAEVLANASRTLDLFSEGPFEVRYGTSVLAFDYPLWNDGTSDARADALRARLDRLSATRLLDDARFTQLVDAFGDLYLTQRQMEVMRPFAAAIDEEKVRTAEQLETGNISNLIAVERRDIALSFTSRLLELEARRIDAAARLQLLTGLESEPVVAIDLAQHAAISAVDSVRDDLVDATTAAVEQNRIRLREVASSSRFRATLSGFAGVGAAESHFRDSTSAGAFGVYGLRLHLSYPLFTGTGGLALAEARLDLAQSETSRDAALVVARSRASEYRLRERTAGKRTELLAESIRAARLREESLRRLVTAGLRSETDIEHARAELARREADLAAAEVDRWKASRLLERMTATGPGRP